MDYRDNRQRWAESHQVVHFYAGQWCTFTPALTVQLEVLCSFVGDESAEIHSHTAIVAEFVNTIWANSKPFVVADEFPVDWKTRKGTNLVIRALLEERRGGDWARWAAALYRGLSTNPRRYLLRWCEDKFLPVGQLLASLKQSED